MRGWLDILLRLAACTLATVVLWQVGVRYLGVSASPTNPWSAYLTPCWIAVIGGIWAVILGPPIVFRLGEILGGLWQPSDKSFRVRPEYSVAEARVKQGRYPEAIEAFRQDIKKFPKEITPHMRIAEILVEQLNDPAAAIAELKAALPKACDVESFAILNHRLADIYIKNLGNSAAAIECLNEIQRRYPNSRRAQAAMERAQRLSPG